MFIDEPCFKYREEKRCRYTGYNSAHEQNPEALEKRGYASQRVENAKS